MHLSQVPCLNLYLRSCFALGEGCFHRRKPFVRFRLALWRLIRNLSVARDGGRKNPRSDLIPSAVLDSMTVGLNIIFLDNDGPNVPITKVVVKKTVLVEAATVSPLLSHHVALTVALHVWSSSELIPADRELIQSESSVAQILSNESILTFRSFVSATEYRKRCLLFIP